MTITGTLTDSSNNKPIAGASFDVYYTGNMQGPANGNFSSDENGNYNYSDIALDAAPNPTISVQAPGYSQLIGNPDFFQGPNQLDPLNTVTTISSTPKWVWIAVIAAIVFAFIYFNKKYKIV